MMLPLRNEAGFSYSRVNGSSNIWLFLTAEFWFGGALSGFLTILTVIKSLLPKPPRDLTGEVVLVTGAASSLGSLLAEEFAKNGCFVICMDNDLRSVEEIAARLRTHYPQRFERIGPSHRKEDSELRIAPATATAIAYSCDLLNRNDIRETAKKINRETKSVDILVNCVGSPNQDIFDTSSRTLMSYYWTVLAFLPSMMHRKKGHVVAVTPVTSNQDAFLGSKVAIASLMESLTQELGNRSGQLAFLTISPVSELNRTEDKERQVARDVVEAIKRNQSDLTVSWISKILYQISCVIYNLLTATLQWIEAQERDDNL